MKLNVKYTNACSFSYGTIIVNIIHYKVTGETIWMDTIMTYNR